MRWVVLVVVLVTGIRLINLLETPVFGDEGLYCYLGYQINHLPPKDSANLVLNVWKDAPLLPVINALALRLFPSSLPLWTCRAAVTVIAGLGAIVLFWLGGWGAVLFYLLNPFNFFLDRTILMEPVLNTAMLMFIGVSLRAMRLGTPGMMALTGLSTGLLLAAKQTGILALPVPLMIAWWQRQNFPYIKRVAAVMAVVATSLIGLAITTTRLSDTAAMHTATNLSLMRIKANAWLMGNWLIQYWSWWIIPVMAVSGWVAIKQKRWELIVIPTMLMGMFAAVGGTLFPRYVLIVTPFVALLAGKAMKSKLGKLGGIILLVIWLRRDVTMLIKPVQAQVARETYYQFWEDWGSGLGTRGTLEWLKQQKIDEATVLWVPQDIMGLWTMGQLSWAPELKLQIRFYTAKDNFEANLTRDRSVLIVATSHHEVLVNQIKAKHQLEKLKATNGEMRNSVSVYRIYEKN